MAVELRIPEAGESIREVQIGTWLKREGEYVLRDEPVVEVETDKASMELPAPESGVLLKILKRDGDAVKVGETIATIDESAARPQPAEGRAPAGRETAKAEEAPEAESRSAATPGGDGSPRAGETRVMPAAARLVAEHGLRASDVKATGPGGRLLKEDVLRHVEAAATDRAAAAGSQPAVGRSEEAVPMTLLRKRIAARLVEAQQTAALLTTFNEIDVADVLALRKEHQDAFQKRYHAKLGLMSFFVKAAIDALKFIPQVNAEIREDAIVYKNYYDVGIAVSTERGLVVPVIRNAERLSFAEIELAIADFSARARERKLTPEELQGGTFTISNGGVFGSLLSTPIVNPPQAAILGLHAIQERPVARGGQVVIRPMMYVALTYDHRLIDGRESVTFLKRIKECIEAPARMLVEV